MQSGRKRGLWCCCAFTLPGLPPSHSVGLSGSLEHPCGELWGAGAELRRVLGNSNKMWVVQLLSINLSPERTIKRGISTLFPF